METLYSLLCLMGVTRMASERVDLVTKLPPEVASIIFRKLDNRSLLNASKVDDTWMKVIKGDRVLRTRLRRQVRVSREPDPLNLGRFGIAGQGVLSRSHKSNLGKNSEFMANVTFRIAEGRETGGLSRPQKRRRRDIDAFSCITRNIKMVRY